LNVQPTFLTACELKNNLRIALLAAMVMMFAPAASSAQEHAPAQQPPTAVPAPGAPVDHKPAQDDHAAPGQAGEAEHHDESIGGMILAMGWPVANFIIFVGVLYYFFNQPLKDYLATRDSTIRKDLVEAADLRATANSQLATIEQKLAALPGELAALRTRGAEEIKSEERRIAAQAAADRDRLLDQTRREIDLQVRLAKKEILEHAADLSVQLATERIKNEVTPADQDRLVDRYLSQVKEQQ
jgi:F-type H+-transporting ATPase subunit b